MKISYSYNNFSTECKVMNKHYDRSILFVNVLSNDNNRICRLEIANDLVEMEIIFSRDYVSIAAHIERECRAAIMDDELQKVSKLFLGNSKLPSLLNILKTYGLTADQANDIETLIRQHDKSVSREISEISRRQLYGTFWPDKHVTYKQSENKASSFCCLYRCVD